MNRVGRLGWVAQVDKKLSYSAGTLLSSFVLDLQITVPISHEK